MKLPALTIIVALLTVGLAACGKNGEASKESAQVAKPPVAVDVAVAAATDLVDGIEVTGSLEPKFSADVKTQIPGLVKQVYVTEWVRVKKGQPLARIDVAESEALARRAAASVESAKAGLAQAQVAANRAEREMARILKLKESGLATQQAVDDARSEVGAANARLEAARAQIGVSEEDVRQSRARLAKGLVSAPLEGVVALRDVNVGDLASDAAAAKPIFRIVDNRLLNLTVTVASADAARIKVGQPLEFTVDSLPGKTFTGKVMYINPELNSADRSLKVIAEVRNTPELLKGGMFAKGRIVTGKRSGVLQVPRSAVSGLDLAAGKGTLFVLDSGLARKRDIRTGTIGDARVEVASGLQKGEQYVVRGGFNLKDGDRAAGTVVK
ncbi:MAG: efflux RND transporter periplasmic adaptor subunit [Geobacter sp.]|nr:MAG: efflux RND transporter periplasmic adaptor subunit [Geobacter sp.]